MVGPPKSLRDLRKIEANLIVTCRTCRHSHEFDRETLIVDLMRRRRNLDWYLLPHHFRCTCGSKDVRLSVVAFADRLRDETRQRFAEAIELVRWSVNRAGKEPIQTEALRVALARLSCHCPDPSWCDRLYRDAGSNNPISISASVYGGWRGILRQLGLPDE
ncbi:hypothetical protein [Sphingomonas montana]|uniref:hypothetical protein n=1 Tax=Sphingomonas montana TaxID=1843236 RepID=UPI00101AD142|nr:hypothetical protein [Sphingomonas montana]